jgi:hypothetical protein
MGPRSESEDESDIAPDVDFSGGERGKYADRFPSGGRMVLLDPDVAERFPDSASVNALLRALLSVMDRRPRSA